MRVAVLVCRRFDMESRNYMETIAINCQFDRFSLAGRGQLEIHLNHMHTMPERDTLVGGLIFPLHILYMLIIMIIGELIYRYISLFVFCSTLHKYI